MINQAREWIEQYPITAIVVTVVVTTIGQALKPSDWLFDRAEPQVVAPKGVDFCASGVKAEVLKLITVQSDTLNEDDPDNAWMYHTTMSLKPVNGDLVVICSFDYANLEPILAPGDIIELTTGRRKL